MKLTLGERRASIVRGGDVEEMSRDYTLRPPALVGEAELSGHTIRTGLSAGGKDALLFSVESLILRAALDSTYGLLRQRFQLIGHDTFAG